MSNIISWGLLLKSITIQIIDSTNYIILFANGTFTNKNDKWFYKYR